MVDGATVKRYCCWIHNSGSSATLEGCLRTIDRQHISKNRTILRARATTTRLPFSRNQFGPARLSQLYRCCPSNLPPRIVGRVRAIVRKRRTLVVIELSMGLFRKVVSARFERWPGRFDSRHSGLSGASDRPLPRTLLAYSRNQPASRFGRIEQPHPPTITAVSLLFLGPRNTLHWGVTAVGVPELPK